MSEAGEESALVPLECWPHAPHGIRCAGGCTLGVEVDGEVWMMDGASVVPTTLDYACIDLRAPDTDDEDRNRWVDPLPEALAELGRRWKLPEVPVLGRVVGRRLRLYGPDGYIASGEEIVSTDVRAAIAEALREVPDE